MSRWFRCSLRVLACAFAWGALPRATAMDRPHPGPPVYIEVEIEEGSVRVVVTGEQQTINPWLGLEPPAAGTVPAREDRPLEGARAEKARRTLESLFARENPIAVDGKSYDFTVGDFAVPADFSVGYGVPAISFGIEWHFEGLPERVRLVWRLYEGAVWNDKVAVPVVFRSFGETDLHVLLPGEPECTWHRAIVKPRERAPVVEVPATLPPPATLPVLPGVVLLVLLASIPLLRRKGVGKSAVVGVCLAAVALGALTWNTIRVPMPWTSPVTVPPADEAIRIFEQLHRNIYAAFDARSEDEIYDRLAVSVDRRLLDELYGQVYESLVLQGQGGAVCKIEKVEVLGREAMVNLLLPSEDKAPRFLVIWIWRVHGIVSHWGHEHRRINRYEANYTVRHDGRSWKIYDMDVVEHSRVDKNG